MKVIVTGAAGFIGFHVCKALLARGDEVIGVDNLNSYYEVKLKEDRLIQIEREFGLHVFHARCFRSRRHARPRRPIPRH